MNICKAIQGVLLIATICLSGTAWAQDKPWTVNFNDADIQEVIRFVADATGKTIIIDPKVRGQIKVISKEPLNSDELYQLFLSILDVHGYTAVESGKVVRIVPNRDARSLSIPTNSENSDDAEGLSVAGSRRQPIDDTYVTQVIRLRHISAAKALPTLRPLVPQHGHLAAYDPSNALIITDTRANISRIISLVEQMDQASVAETELVQLRYARATDVVNLLTQLKQGESDSGKQLALVADERINGILIRGDEMQRQQAKILVDRIDMPQASDSNVRVVYLKYAEAEPVAQILSGVVQNLARMQLRQGGEGGGEGEPSIQADPDTNALLITADSDTMQALLTVVDSLDIRRAQVLVEAIIVEIDDSDGRELGINWMYRDDDYGFGSSSSGDGRLGSLGVAAVSGDDGLPDLASGLSGTAGQIFGFGRLGERTDLFGILRLLQESSSSNILSTPSLLTTDNHTASISVGQNVPFVTGSFSSVSGGSTQPQNPFQTIERKDVGILLEVTPHVNDGNSVVLDISQEVSSVLGEGSTAGIITNQRRIETQVLADDGEVVVLGGLIKDDVKSSNTQVPLLGSLPVLGHLFRSQSSEVVKTNLMVFIRATVIREDQLLTGATAEKYRAIRDDQMERQRNSGILINSRDMPVIPEWSALYDETEDEDDDTSDQDQGDRDDSDAQSTTD